LAATSHSSSGTTVRSTNTSSSTTSSGLRTNQVHDTLSKFSGEEIPGSYINEAELRAQLEEAKKAPAESPGDFMKYAMVHQTEYMINYGIRGDNTPEYAEYLGYVDGKKLLEGKVKMIYEEKYAAMMKDFKKNKA
jgi:hypothetical protein